MASVTKKEPSAEKDKFKIPQWSAKPPAGTHLDVLKSKQLLQKLLIDEKGYYYFGRNPLMCDFVVEHASCSRVHALLLYHRLLKRFAMVDLESCHGTFVENVRIQPLTPVFLDFDATFHFGASTRRYAIRSSIGVRDRDEDDAGNGASENFSLPADEFEVDNLTEFNTAQNRRVPQIPISVEEARRKLRPRPKLQFTDEEDIINPEDVDPSVGRFRNLVRTAVIPSSSTAFSAGGGKRAHSANNPSGGEQTEQLFDFYAPPDAKKHAAGQVNSRRTSGESGAKSAMSAPAGATFGALFSSTTLGAGIALNAAPDLDLYANVPAPTKTAAAKSAPSAKAARYYSGPAGDLRAADEEDAHAAANKKKYAKEAWPGRKPTAGII